jgi:serine/threonine protein kinase
MNKDPSKFKNIRKEINIMQNLNHDKILKLIESVETLTKISLVVEYGGDMSLLDYLKLHYPV